MKKIPITYKIAHAAGWDEGNRAARKAGRKAWNREDRNVAAETMHRLFIINNNRFNPEPLGGKEL